MFAAESGSCFAWVIPPCPFQNVGYPSLTQVVQIDTDRAPLTERQLPRCRSRHLVFFPKSQCSNAIIYAPSHEVPTAEAKAQTPARNSRKESKSESSVPAPVPLPLLRTTSETEYCAT
ncbi:hypothetical protein IscW_ISCW024231 [Ixodes scapularis]|uniref:Uncharacterized protein n=1 Tax=Ixodes scapularis TaxID=6945 RepID=B7PHY9_IXOSC|nr:hypothetical protein IscW_ISCW024231 [Ixodes scapularis]|eukprot:XP_002403850.1 hypothetical protein IscW_ISCW024231 [Ixodes scapularis]